MIDKKIEFTASAPTWIREGRWQKVDYITNWITGKTYKVNEDLYICVHCHKTVKEQSERCPNCNRTMNTTEEWEEHFGKAGWWNENH